MSKENEPTFIPSDAELAKAEQRKKEKANQEKKEQKEKELKNKDITKEVARVKKNTDKLIQDLNKVYEVSREKNLYDAIIYLDSVKNLINSKN